MYCHFHLVCAFSPCMDIFTLCRAFSSHVAILTLHGHSHLIWGIFTFSWNTFISHGHSHLMCRLCGRHTLCAPLHHHYISHLVHTLPQQQTSHLTCTLHASLHMKIIFFISCIKFPKIVTKQPQFHQCGTSTSHQ